MIILNNTNHRKCWPFTIYRTLAHYYDDEVMSSNPIKGHGDVKKSFQSQLLLCLILWIGSESALKNPFHYQKDSDSKLARVFILL